MNREELLTTLAESPAGEDLRTHLADPTVRFVFPSQAAADSWSMILLEHGDVPAIATDRFLGEDAALDLLHGPQSAGLQKIDRSATWAWAASALDLFLKQKPGALHTLLPARAPSADLASTLVGMLPSIRTLISSTGRRLAGQIKALPGELRSMNLPDLFHSELEDYCEIAAHYLSWLDEHHFYDPDLGFAGHEQAAVKRGSRFRCYFGALMTKGVAAGSGVEHVEFAGSTTRTDCLKFDTALDEYQWILADIQRALDEGLEPRDIVIAICGLTPEHAAWLGEMAARAGIPLSIRLGRSLMASASGRILAAIVQAARQGLDTSAIEAFTATGAIRERRPDFWHSLRKAAPQLRIPSPAPDSRMIRNLWDQACRSRLLEQETALTLQRLLSDLEAVAASTSMQDLRTRLQNFLSTWALTGMLSEDPFTDLTHRRLLSELAQLQRFDDLWTISDIKPVDLAISYLSTVRYLPEMHANAVQVHDYSTTEGYAALRMYVAGASLEGLQRYAIPARGLRRELVTLLELAQPRDLARSLQAHQLGQTIFSHATAGFSGFESPHPLMHATRPAAGKACTPTLVEQLLWEQVWAGDASSIIGDCRIRITQGQRLRFEQAGHALRKPGYNEPSRLSADLVNAVLRQTASRAGDVPRFDPHSLKEYSQCPCKWFAARLRLEDELPKDRTDLVLGNLLHQIYREFVTSLDNSWQEPAMALPLLQQAARTSMEYILRKEGEGYRPLLESYLAMAVHRLGLLYQYEYEHFREFSIRKFETKLEAMLVSEGAVLGGRMDCIMERETDGVQEGVIIDYKKKTIPKHRNLQILQTSSLDEDEEEDSSTLEELQVPIYAMLYNLQGGLPAAALYHSIENNKQAFYLKPVTPGSKEALENAETLAAAERAIRSLVSRSVSLLNDGHLLDPAFERTSCGNCSFKPLCRYWYFSEF